MDNGIIWKIAKWDVVFEKAESRRHKILTWVSMPVDFNSSGYQSLLEEFNGGSPAIYGAWCALVKFAAQCPTRGVLANSQRRPISLHHIARVTGFDVDVFEQLFGWATKVDVAWLIPESTTKQDENGSPSNGPAMAQQNAVLQDPTLPNKTQPNPTNECATDVAPKDPCPESTPPQKKAAEIPPEDVPLPAELDTAVFRSARDAWFTNRRRRRKTLRAEYVAQWFKKLAPLGAVQAAACLMHTVDNEYDGIFPEKFNGSAQQPKQVSSGQRFRGPATSA